MILMFASCQEKLIYTGDDKLNAGPFKRNLLKKGCEWEVCIQEHYYTDNIAQDFLGKSEPVLVGSMFFSDEKPDGISIAGRGVLFNATNGTSQQMLYQVSARSIIEVALWDVNDGKTSNHQGFEASQAWSKENMIWTKYDHGHSGDTLTKYEYHLKNIGY